MHPVETSISQQHKTKYGKPTVSLTRLVPFYSITRDWLHFDGEKKNFYWVYEIEYMKQTATERFSVYVSTTNRCFSSIKNLEYDIHSCPMDAFSASTLLAGYSYKTAKLKIGWEDVIEATKS